MKESLGTEYPRAWGCYKKCPPGNYFLDPDDNVCKGCHFSCKTCKGLSPYSCTECAKGFYWDGDKDKNTLKCLDECPFGKYKNSTTMKCETCSIT